MPHGPSDASRASRASHASHASRASHASYVSRSRRTALAGRGQGEDPAGRVALRQARVWHQAATQARCEGASAVRCGPLSRPLTGASAVRTACFACVWVPRPGWGGWGILSMDATELSTGRVRCATLGRPPHRPSAAPAHGGRRGEARRLRTDDGLTKGECRRGARRTRARAREMPRRREIPGARARRDRSNSRRDFLGHAFPRSWPVERFSRDAPGRRGAIRNRIVRLEPQR
jgi:hypothetical protein